MFIKPSSRKPSRHKESVDKAKVRRASANTQASDYNYYEYRIEKVSSIEPSTHKTSQDEHIDAEVSTKSEDVLEDTRADTRASTVRQSQALEVKDIVEAAPSQTETVLPDNKQPDEAEEDSLVTANPKNHQGSSASRRQRRKQNKRQQNTQNTDQSFSHQELDAMQEQLKDSRGIEPYSADCSVHVFDPQEAKQRLKLMEKQKRDGKDVLRDLTSKVAEAENLDVYEKAALLEINSLDSISKKMKQKARKRFRAAVNAEKVKRNIAVDIIDEDADEDEFEDEDASVLESYINCSQFLPEADHRNLADFKQLLAQRTSCLTKKVSVAWWRRRDRLSSSEARRKRSPRRA